MEDDIHAYTKKNGSSTEENKKRFVVPAKAGIQRLTCVGRRSDVSRETLPCIFATYVRSYARYCMFLRRPWNLFSLHVSYFTSCLGGRKCRISSCTLRLCLQFCGKKIIAARIRHSCL